MCDFGLVSAGISLATGALGFIGQQQQARAQANATRQAAEYQSQVAAQNAQVAEMQARDAIERGQQERQRLRAEGAQVMGTQRAALASAGVDIASGSALDTISDTAAVTELDAVTIRDNAAREAWALRVQAQNERANAGLYSLRARNARASPWTGVSTFLGGLGASYDQFSRWRAQTAKVA